MAEQTEEITFKLIYVIVNYGLGSKVINFAKKHGVTGGTIFLGSGTVPNRFLEFLALNEVRKEIILMVAENTVAEQALTAINIEFHLEKPNHGIAFSLPVNNFFGAHDFSKQTFKESRGVKEPMHNAIFVIVDKGKGELVIDTAAKKGAKGGTIIHARGSGIHKSIRLFGMEIEPEKEIVLILCAQDLTEGIVSHVCEEMRIDEPGNGIIFTQGVETTYGLRKE